MRHVLVVLSLLGSVVGLSAGATGAAGASTPPSVTLHTVHASISVGQRPTFTYRARDLRSGSQIVLERKIDGNWQGVAHSAEHSGDVTGTLKAHAAAALGLFRYRAEVVRNGNGVVHTARHPVKIYGSVTMNALCHGALDNYCVHGKRTLNDGSTFKYVMATGVNEPSDPWSAEIESGKTSCRAMTFRYISDDQDSTHTYLELRQKGEPTQKHTSSSEVVGKFTAKLTGKAFGMSVEMDSAQVFMYFNGSGSCYTADGKA